MRPELLGRPSFENHFEGVVLDWGYIEARSEAALRPQAPRYATRPYWKVERDLEVRRRLAQLEKQVVVQRWLWQAPFTIQELRNDVRKGQWVNVRQSRMFEASRDAQLEIERQKAQSKKVKSIVLD